MRRLDNTGGADSAPSICPQDGGHVLSTTIAVSLALIFSPVQASADRKEIYRWLDSLGYGFAKAPFVQVADEGISGYVDKTYGFLVRRQEAPSGVLDPDLVP
jgi:hypothetical protein